MVETTKTAADIPLIDVSANPEAVSRVNAVIGSAFTTVPMARTFVVELDKLPPPYPEFVPKERLEKYFEPRIKSLANSGASFVQAGNYSAVAIWHAPGFTLTQRAAPPPPLRQEKEDKINDAKARHMAYSREPDDKPPQGITIIRTSSGSSATLRPYYGLLFLARDPNSPPVPGAVSAVIRPFLEKARREGAAVWLEASGPQAMAVYEHFGFRFVEKITVGIDTHGTHGWPEEGGEGVSVWAMLWEPQESDRDDKY